MTCHSMMILSNIYVAMVAAVLVIITSNHVSAKGGIGSQLDHNEAEEEKYPSETLGSYLPYYLDYFTPSGFYYAANQLKSERTASVCENHEPYFNNGTTLGEFPCPMEKDPDSFKYCCGKTNFQYCCKLIDKPGFLMMVILLALAAIAVLILVLVFICCFLKSKKGAVKRKQEQSKQMQEMGIPRYDERTTSKFHAIQSPDGYQIHVSFKAKSFFKKIVEQLEYRHPNLGWKKSSHSRSLREAKLTFSDGSWVGLVVADSVDGKAEMLVVREKAAIAWMEGEFEDICEQVGVDSGGCLCFGRKRKLNNKTHPANQSPVRNGGDAYRRNSTHDDERVSTTEDVMHDSTSQHSYTDHDDNSTASTDMHF